MKETTLLKLKKLLINRRREMLERSGGRHTVPQIFINGKSIGGYDDLSRLNAAGELG